jgi:hypothetical protein
MKEYFLNYFRLFLLPLCILGFILASGTSSHGAGAFKEINGLVVIEAENYHAKTSNGTKRDWYVFPSSSATPTPDHDGVHTSGAGNGKYVEALPDTRVTHDDPLQPGVNFFSTGSNAPRLSYRVLINSAGRYYIRARLYSTSTEDNGVHFGVDNTWPLSGTAMQWCGAWNVWKWSGARRTEQNHCGVENGIYFDLSAGEHTIMLAMREDGAEIDRFVMTKDKSYMPSGVGPAQSPYTDGGTPPPPPPGNQAPKVNAGADQTISIDEAALLDGIATDDGIPGGTLYIEWKKIKGPGDVSFANPSKLQTSVSFNAIGLYELELSAHDGELKGTDRIGINVADGSADQAFQQDSGANGLLVMEAENFDGNVDKGDHGWNAILQYGVKAMEAAPDAGSRIATNYVSNSPYLRFNVNFLKTGTHYLWLRGYCTGSDNSAHAGLDGKSSVTSENITLPVNKDWVWSGSSAEGQRTTVNVSKAGLHTIEIWMREDGLILDRVLLTTSMSYKPSGSGPAQSPRK